MATTLIAVEVQDSISGELSALLYRVETAAAAIGAATHRHAREQRGVLISLDARARNFLHPLVTAATANPVALFGDFVMTSQNGQFRPRTHWTLWIVHHSPPISSTSAYGQSTSIPRSAPSVRI